MMDSLEQRYVLEVACRQDLTTFIHRAFQVLCPGQEYMHNWHIEALAWHLEQCANGDITRLLITMPPRYLKSICASVAFPAWVLGHDPTRRIVCASYSAELAAKHAVDTRRLMESLAYHGVFPAARIGRDKNREMDFVTTRGGYRLSTSVGGTLTGRGGNLIIVDDPMKSVAATQEAQRAAVREWFDGTLYSRLDDKRLDPIIVIMQRLHLEDLIGHLLDKDERWTHLSLSAIAEVDQKVEVGRGRVYFRRAGEVLHEAREPRAVLDQAAKELGTYNFSAQYQQRPIPLEGELIKWCWFKGYDQEPTREGDYEIVQSWDTAAKDTEHSDYAVCTTWFVKGADYYLLHVLRKKMLYPDLRRLVIAHAREHGANVVIIEDACTGSALIQDIDDSGDDDFFELVEVRPDTDKLTRMHAQSAVIEGGRVHLPADADWLEAFRAELLQFPSGRYDDQVDSVSQFLRWAEVDRADEPSVIWI